MSYDMKHDMKQACKMRKKATSLLLQWLDAKTQQWSVISRTHIYLYGEWFQAGTDIKTKVSKQVASWRGVSCPRSV